MEELARPLEKAGASIFARIGEAITKPAIPEAAERTVEGMMTGKATPLKFRSGAIKDIPHPELSGQLTSTEPDRPPVTIDGLIQKAKEVAGSFIRRDPNLPKDAQKTLYEGAVVKEGADSRAHAMQREIHAPLQRDPVNQANTVNAYLVSLDEVAQAGADGRDTIRGAPLEHWQTNADALGKMVAADPEMSQNLQNRLDATQKIFDDMRARGQITLDRAPEDYTHIRRARAISDALAGEEGKEPSSAYLRAAKAMGGNETDLIKLEGQNLRGYIEKAAADDTFDKLMTDPTLNLTNQYQVGDRVAAGHIAYLPSWDMVGYKSKNLLQRQAEGAASELGTKFGLGKIVMPGSVVVPEQIGTAIKDFNIGKGRAPQTEVEKYLMKGVRAVKWGMTIGNPAATRLNFFSDFPLAMFGLPGEKAQPLGVLKYSWDAKKAAFNIARGKPYLMKIGNQMVDIRAMTEAENVGEATLFHEIQGNKVADELARLYPEAARNQNATIFDVLHRDRFENELHPRIAAGLEAYSRTGDVKEFGRYARESTLKYGAGAPKASRIPLFKFMSGFLQFPGLAAGHMVDMLHTPGSRVRALTGLLAVPPIMNWWNTRNPEFQKVEDALSPFERDQLHTIMPDWHDPTKPMLDVEGNPVVIRCRFWIPEEVMKLAGLGNYASRIQRVVQGKDTIGKALASVPINAGKSAAESITMMPSLLSDITQEDQPGKHKSFVDKMMQVLPPTRPFARGIEEGRNHGLVSGLETTAQELSGFKRANVMRRGSNPSNADIVIARSNIKAAQSAYRRAAINNEGDKTLADRKNDLDNAVKELDRLVEVYKKQKEAQNAEK